MKNHFLITFGSLGAATMLLLGAGSASAFVRHADAAPVGSEPSYLVAQYQEPPRHFDPPPRRLPPPPLPREEILPPRYDGPRQGAPDNAVLEQIEERALRQQQRIANGVRNGDLSRREARRLEEQQRSIRQLQRRARADGVLTPAELIEIQTAQDEAGEAIRRLRNNDGTRY